VAEAVRANPGAEVVKVSAYYPGPSLDVLPVDPMPEVSIAAFSIADLSKAGRASAAGPARLQVAESRKMPASVLSPQIKIAAAYTHAAFAKARAKAAGCHDVLFLDDHDNLTESSTQSFFLVCDGVLRCAPLDATLAGVTRRLAVALAEDEKIPVEEEPMPRSILAHAQEAFLTGTTSNVWPVSRIDALELAEPGSGPITRAAGRASRSSSPTRIPSSRRAGCRRSSVSVAEKGAPRRITGARVLSGVQPSGVQHLGNYFGALRQFISLQEGNRASYFVADLHSLTSIRDAKERRELTRGVALDFLALGVDPARSILYRQSDLPEVTELAWILTTVTPMGLLERCVSYKEKLEAGLSPDHGLFAYPVLQAADILIWRANWVPVGMDQKQHLEVTRDIAGKFNRTYARC
jgi:branched-subunit amino acid aminotransferase/4-amino-4-deoxychorismate lyase